MIGGRHARHRYARIAADQNTGRQIGEALGTLARYIGILIEGRDLMRGNIGKFQERVPAQSEVKGDAAAELEVILHKRAVQVPQQVVI